MAKRFKTIKKVELEEPRSGKGARSATTQNVIRGPKPPVWEIIIYGLLILFLMTGTFWRNRAWNSELELWTDCVKKSPNKGRPHYNLADAFLDLGKYPEAISHLNDALQINPNYAEAHNNLGLVFFYQGKYQEAIPHLNDALRINPDYAEAHNNLANIFFYQGKYREAISHLNDALRINPDYAEAHNNLGNVYLMMGNRSLALREYEILKAMNSSLANALYQKIK